VIRRRARQLGVGDQLLRKWDRQAEIDGDPRRGTTTDVERIRELEGKVRELRRSNENLKATSVFATELDDRSKKQSRSSTTAARCSGSSRSERPNCQQKLFAPSNAVGRQSPPRSR
jgi:transposase